MPRTTVVGLSLVALTCVLLLSPAAARAQQASGIAGVVRDTSGGVLPGVTVEAASPALIEKVRTVVTDSQGRYNIVDLRLGTYSVTFALAGFNTFRREGIELTAGFTATVNADMQVGALEETITVTGAAPLVDTQNVRKQAVISSELLETLPTGNRGVTSFITLTPGLSGPADVGGSIGGHRSMSAQTTRFHGRASGKINLDGMSVLNPTGEGNASYIVNAAIVEEMVLETGGISAESAASGFAFNAIPKEGGNTFRYSAAGRFTNSSLQSDNSSEELRSRGLTTVDSILRIYDGSVSVGGPITQDRLWFFGATRYWGNSAIIGGVFWNKTPGTLFYTPDFDRPSDRVEYYRSWAGRVTWQASSRNKVSVFTDVQNNWVKRNFGADAPEAKGPWHFWPAGLYQAAWTMPATSRLLLEAGAGLMNSAYSGISAQPGVDPYRDISILELSTNFRYNAATTYSLDDDFENDRYTARSSVSYVTGSHAFKGGVQIDRLVQGVRNISNDLNVSYDFLNGVPNRLTQRATPSRTLNRVKADLGIFVQDQWTINRLTLNYGLRFDYFNGYVPEQLVPATLYVPEHRYAAVHGVPLWKDLNPRAGASYDLFGDGKTALKVSLGRYGEKMSTTITGANNPISTTVSSVNRTWNDANGNYVPDCDLKDFAANGECGAINNLNFGRNNPNATRYADDVLRGFGARGFNWDFMTAVQQELRSGMSATAGYYRNWSGNFRVTDNLAVTAADYSPYCITAPVDPRLPGGGGYQVCGLYDIAPAKFGQVSDVVTQASNFGNQSRVSDFFSFSFDTRLGAGIQLGGGVDTGRIVTDECFVIDSPQRLLNCRVAEPFHANTQVKLHGSYPLPGDLVLSGTFQNVAGPAFTADYPAPNAAIAPSLGRNLAACGTRAVCTSTATVPLIAPQTQFEARRTQLDLRLGKLVQVGSIRLRVNLDVYNALNANSILVVNNTYGPLWRRPGGATTTGTSTLDGRLVAFSGDLSF